MDVNFEYYKVFYYVAKYQNFTKAAKVLGSSQPNITREMNCLEEETGCTLFIRTNRGVRLTPEGESLYAHVSAAMGQFQAAEDEMAENLSLEHGSIAIGASETALNIFRLRDDADDRRAPSLRGPPHALPGDSDRRKDLHGPGQPGADPL